MGHIFNRHYAFLSEGRALAVVVRDFPETPHQTRDKTDFPRPLRESEARLRLVGPPRPARRTRGVLAVRATPSFLPLIRHRAGVNGPP